MLNHLARFALEFERRVAFDREVEEFFEDALPDRDEQYAFELATLASWTRDE